MPSLGLVDGPSLGLHYLLKTMRLLTFVLAVFVAEKTLQSMYVDRVYVQKREPPSIVLVPMYLIAAESAVFLVVFSLLLGIERKFYKSPNTFVVDAAFMLQAFVDYVITTSAIALAGLTIFAVVTSSSDLRYKHDGLRAIRAACAMFIAVTAVFLLVPGFLAQ